MSLLKDTHDVRVLTFNFYLKYFFQQISVFIG